MGVDISEKKVEMGNKGSKKTNIGVPWNINLPSSVVVAFVDRTSFDQDGSQSGI